MRSPSNTWINDGLNSSIISKNGAIGFQERPNYPNQTPAQEFIKGSKNFKNTSSLKSSKTKLSNASSIGGTFPFDVSP